MGRAPGRPGAVTLDSVDDLKARAASADQERRTRLNKRLRQAFIAGAELDSQLGRGLTDEELERALRRYPGDMVGSGSAAQPRATSDFLIRRLLG